MKDFKKVEKYFEKHAMFNSSVHTLIGMGIGILMTYPLVGVHPMRWGVLFLAIGIIGHLYPMVYKTK